MSKKVITIILFLVVLIGIFCYFYFYYEKPVKEEAQNLINISIYAENFKSKELMETNFSIIIGGTLEGKYMTSSDYPYLKRFDKSQSILIKSTNYTFYNDEVLIVPLEENISRARLSLVEPTPIDVEYKNRLLYEDKIIFNLSTREEFRNIIVCAKWSKNFLWVKSDYLLIEDRNKLGKYNKCFNTELSVNETTNQSLEFTYKEWDFLDQNDYIEFYFMDSEDEVSGLEVGEDYWGKNKEVKLTISNIDN